MADLAPSTNTPAATEAVDQGLHDAIRKREEQQRASADDIQRHLEELQAKYDAEKEKRLRADGVDQYIDTYTSPRFKHFSDDPFAASEPHYGKQRAAENGDYVPYFIMGAGMAGLGAAMHLVKTGVAANDIRIVDSAGGFGGTWYWNRYPGIACDVESYIYLPYLEESGYIPKHRYSYGAEIRTYLNSLADMYDLRRNALFSTNLISAQWDEDERVWLMTIQQHGNAEKVKVKAKFAFFAPGVLHIPKIPDLPGLEDFEGEIFHTSRWNYDLTGGSELDPEMTKLKDKTVAIMGTGATAIQAVPKLAKWAKKLYVIQRTPSAVDWRGQRVTHAGTFRKEVANKPGWQRDRHTNFARCISDHPEKPSVNLVNDAWTYAPSLKAMLGSTNGPSKPEEIPQFLAHLHELDFARQQQIRQRVDEIVKDSVTAEKLKPWYPSWCKRPTYSDEYLPTFNRANVELVDTNGKGAESFSKAGIVVNGTELATDLVILSTGYRSPGSSPGKRADIDIVGRNGLRLDDKFETNWNSLHAVMSRDFPNMFLFLVNQWSSAANFAAMMDRIGMHSALILKQAAALHPKAGDLARSRVVIQPAEEAEKAWGDRIVMRAIGLAAMAGCTPSYFNAEGTTAKMPIEKQIASARKAPWGEGWPSLSKIIDAWEADGKLEGLEISF